MDKNRHYLEICHRLGCLTILYAISLCHDMSDFYDLTEGKVLRWCKYRHHHSLLHLQRMSFRCPGYFQVHAIHSLWSHRDLAYRPTLIRTTTSKHDWSSFNQGSFPWIFREVVSKGRLSVPKLQGTFDFRPKWCCDNDGIHRQGCANRSWTDWIFHWP